MINWIEATPENIEKHLEGDGENGYKQYFKTKDCYDLVFLIGAGDVCHHRGALYTEHGKLLMGCHYVYHFCLRSEFEQAINLPTI